MLPPKDNLRFQLGPRKELSSKQTKNGAQLEMRERRRAEGADTSLK